MADTPAWQEAPNAVPVPSHTSANTSKKRRKMGKRPKEEEYEFIPTFAPQP
jgi:hypothetical protein